MRASVRSAFVAFSTPLEGCLTFLYGDVEGYVTTAIGVKVDPVDQALGLPFVHDDGTPATRAEILGAWSAVKARRDLTTHGGMAYKGVTSIRLTPDGINQVTFAKLDQDWGALARRFGPDLLQTLPADAQLGLLSLTWACGPAFRFPKFEAALRASDFTTCAAECEMDTVGNPGLIHRNAANRTLFLNAAQVVSSGMDPDVLHWPAALYMPPPEAA